MLVGGCRMTTLSVGRHSDCQIVIDHPTVSRRHAEIEAAAGGKFTVEDTDSAGGTFVRDGDIWRRVRRATVSLRDVLRLGEFETSVADLLARIADPLVVLQFGRAGTDSPAGSPRSAGRAEQSPKRKPGSGRFERDPATGLIIEKP